MEYSQIAIDSRKKVLELVHKAGTSHIGSLFSAADLFAVIFGKINLDKDRFCLSAGWKAALLYYHLWKKGRITEEELNSYCQGNSEFIGLAEPIHKDIPVAGGSMGWGAAMSVGLATAWKKLHPGDRVYTLISDGELQTETMGAVARNALKRKLDNLVFILDNNGFCAMGKTDDILPIDPRKLFYGWHIVEIDGHNYEEIDMATSIVSDRPILIIADTIKGKGVPNWEGDNLWHYAQVKEDDYNYALSCLK